MKKIFLSAIILFILSPVFAQLDNNKIAQQLAGRAVGTTPFIDDLRELCDQIGGRPTGSPACERAVEWAAAKFRVAGVDNVSLEPFSVPNLWLPQSAEASCLSPESFSIRLAATPYSPSTPQTIETKLVNAGNGSVEAFERLGTAARGAIAIVSSHEMKSLDDLFLEYLQNKPIQQAAEKAGVSALLLQSTRSRGLLYRHPVSLNGTIAPIPTAIISREHAARLIRLLDKGEVRLRLTLANKISGAYQSRNVVAEIRGREKPAEIVLLGAHLDSWDLGTGAQDNGVNVALVIDVARAFKQLGIVPRRTIRFVLFTGEEQGMWGSAGYVQRHAAELDNHIAAVIFDIGSGRTMGFFLNGRAELHKPIDEALGSVVGLGAINHTIDGVDGTDNFDFLLSGVPNLVANQEATPYLPDYHAESDVFEMVDIREAKANTAIASVLIWGLAENPVRPAKRQSRDEIEKLLKETKLDEQMKAFGQWDDWISGKRGVNR
ncbi:MAG: M20/M25/M40 family metallo-hydrolase [Acidobacteriota bacterium]